MLWIALAAELSSPVPTNLSRWFSHNDVPRYLLEKSPGFWQVKVGLTVGPDSRLHACEVEATSGISQLDKHSCEILRKRAKFRPARWKGAPTYGLYRTSVKWAVADIPWDTTKVSNPDLDIQVESLPAGLMSPTLVRVMFAVDAKGNMSSCTAEPPTLFEKVENHPLLVPVACDQLIKNYRAKVARDGGAGVAVLSIQNALVRFSTSDDKFLSSKTRAAAPFGTAARYSN